MTIETKRDVLLNAVDALSDAQANDGSIGYQDADLFMAEYDAALPDDLPVIPEAVGKYIKEAKFEDVTLLEALGCARDPVFKNLGRWITSHSEEFARAWVLGVWRVEETGEVVKL